MVKLWKHIQAKEFLYLYNHYQLNRRIRKGIPESLRGHIWMHYLHINDSIAKYGPRPSLTNITSMLPAIVLEDIDKDVDRTFPTHELFVQGINTAIYLSIFVVIFFTYCIWFCYIITYVMSHIDNGYGQNELKYLLQCYAALDLETGVYVYVYVYMYVYISNVNMCIYTCVYRILPGYEFYRGIPLILYDP